MPVWELALTKTAAEMPHPKTKAMLSPAGLDAEPLKLPAGADPRAKLAEWIVAPDNPFFARAQVNQVWKHFFGRGIVDPEDDSRATNPASDDALLNALAAHFLYAPKVPLRPEGAFTPREGRRGVATGGAQARRSPP